MYLPPLCKSAGAGSTCPPHAGLRRLAEGSLGTTWKIGAPPQESESKSFDVGELQVNRFHLQAVAREIVPETALYHCLRRRHKNASMVEVRKGQDRAYLAGLQTCHSVWCCPVCSVKISEQRKSEVETAIGRFELAGGVVLMLTQTVRHHAGQSLADVLEPSLQARKLMMHRKPYKRISAELNLQGSIRGLEVTWGVGAGWHVHFHELLFLLPLAGSLGDDWGHDAYFWGQACSPIESAILPEWQKACSAAGLSLPDCHGIKVTGGREIGGYLAKWGRAQEMTKCYVKKGHGERFTPWDFLRRYDETREERWAGLFREYSRGFKGKRQLVWSENLKKMLLIDQKSDEEIAAAVDPLDEVLAFLEPSDWRLILRYEKRGELLKIAYDEGSEGVKRFLRRLRAI